MNFPFQDGDVPRSTSYGVYISQLIVVAQVSSHVDDFNTGNKVLTAKLPSQDTINFVRRFQTFIGGIFFRFSSLFIICKLYIYIQQNMRNTVHEFLTISSRCLCKEKAIVRKNKRVTLREKPSQTIQYLASLPFLCF